jgi:hypothetical protein
MGRYLPKAEKMFQLKLKALLTPLEYGYVVGEGIEYDICGDVLIEDGHLKIHEYNSMYGDFRTGDAAELFFQYGNYLLLIEENDDVRVKTEPS